MSSSSWTKFRDAGGRLRTMSLFEETITDEVLDAGIKPVYTLKKASQSKLGLPSLYEAYLDTMDPTGYTLAKKYLDGFPHYKRLWDSKYLYETFFQMWEEELKVKMRSEVIQSMYITAISEGAKGVAAAKYVAEQAWTKSDASALIEKAKAEKIRREARAKNKRRDNHIVEDDLARIRERASKLK